MQAFVHTEIIACSCQNHCLCFTCVLLVLLLEAFGWENIDDNLVSVSVSISFGLGCSSSLSEHGISSGPACSQVVTAGSQMARFWKILSWFPGWIALWTQLV